MAVNSASRSFRQITGVLALTGAHAVHLIGGLLALMFLWLRSLRKLAQPALVAKRQAAADAVSIYWHFMDGLWIYLFLLLFLWR